MAKIIGWTGKMLVELFNFFLEQNLCEQFEANELNERKSMKNVKISTKSMKNERNISNKKVWMEGNILL